MKNFLALVFLAGFFSASLSALERPNILWLTNEDSAAHYFALYGDKNGLTPNLDKLASQGVVYTHAYANGPICSIARNTIIHGMYSTTLGNQHHRSRYSIPEDVKPYVYYLRKAGYYCTNNSKTDYNALINFGDSDKKSKRNDSQVWDECSKTAHYKNTPKGKPFFAIFNNTVTHESSLFDSKIKSNRKANIIPQTPRVDLKDVDLPPYYPDTRDIRQDIAIYYDNITALDNYIGKMLEELKSLGLADDTIVFCFSDHGGILPREKRYLYDTGTHVPMVVYFPEKWKHLAPKGSRCGDLISFVDLAPTLLSLAGADIPQNMQGKAFLGEKATKERAPYVYTYVERADEDSGSIRAITDGKFRYMKNLMPFRSEILNYSTFQYGQKGWVSWRDEFVRGRTNALQSKYWLTPQWSEQLFDTENDKWEVCDLTFNASYSEKLKTMRDALRTIMLETRDTGIIPESMFSELATGKTLHEIVNDKDFPYEDILDAVWRSTSRGEAGWPKISTYLKSKISPIRYWGLVGSLYLGERAEPVHNAIIKISQTDESFTNRVTAFYYIALYINKAQGLAGLNEEIKKASHKAQKLYVLSKIREFTGGFDAEKYKEYMKLVGDKSEDLDGVMEIYKPVRDDASFGRIGAE